MLLWELTCDRGVTNFYLWHCWLDLLNTLCANSSIFKKTSWNVAFGSTVTIVVVIMVLNECEVIRAFNEKHFQNFFNVFILQFWNVPSWQLKEEAGYVAPAVGLTWALTWGNDKQDVALHSQHLWNKIGYCQRWTCLVADAWMLKGL